MTDDALADVHARDEARSPRLASTLWLARGRHRVAYRLALVLLLLGVAGVACRALADATAAVVQIGGAFDALATLLSYPGAVAVGAAGAVILFGVRLHPAFSPGYLAWLTITPWHPRRPLPLGDFGPASSFVWLPVAAVGVLAALRQTTAAPIACGATLGYAAIGAAAALLTRHDVLPVAIALVALALVPTWESDAQWHWPAILLATLALGGLAQRASLRAAFVRDRVIDIRRLVLQRRGTFGWFENLPLERKPRRRGRELLFALAIGGAVAMVGVAAELRHGRDWRGPLTGLTVIAAGIRLFSIFAAAPPAFGPVARLLTGRWFVPRMDRLLVFPAVVTAWVYAMQGLLEGRPSDWTPLVGGACVTVGCLLCWWVAPGALAWQLTGASRIVTAASKTQKQAEANLKRLTDPQSALRRSDGS